MCYKCKRIQVSFVVDTFVSSWSLNNKNDGSEVEKKEEILLLFLFFFSNDG